MKPFNLEEAKAGKQVCTRSGLSVRIVDFNIKNGRFPILALVDNGVVETPQTYRENGKWSEQEKEDGYDLVMKETKKRGWINIVIDRAGTVSCAQTIWPTKDEAMQQSTALEIYGKNIIDTVEIEWKE